MDGCEFGGPAWGLGGSPMAFLPGGRSLLCVYGGPGTGGSRLGVLDVTLDGATIQGIELPPHASLSDGARRPRPPPSTLRTKKQSPTGSADAAAPPC